MHIHLEAPDNHTIRSYTNEQVTIGDTAYQNSILISREMIISPWPINAINELNELNETNLDCILKLQPEIILIGHQEAGISIPMTVMHYLSKQRIGIEGMSIGAASRTFNVLLSEQRRVVLGIIFREKTHLE